MAVKYCWSLNEEEYRGEYEDRDAAIEAACEDVDGEGEHQVWIGVAKPVDVAEYVAGLIDPDRILEDLDEAIGEDIMATDPFDSAPLVDPTPEQITDLARELTETLERWVRENGITCRRYRVGGVEEVLVRVTETGYEEFPQPQPDL